MPLAKQGPERPFDMVSRSALHWKTMGPTAEHHPAAGEPKLRCPPHRATIIATI